MYIYIYRHKVPHEAVVSHSVQVFFPSKKVFPCMLTSLHLQDDVLLNGDLPIIFRCYVWFCLHKKEKYVKHDKKIQTNTKKIFQNIPHISDIYWLCLHKMENVLKHNKNKKHETFQNIPHIPDIYKLCSY
jgi:hypothetical protein